MLSLGLRLLLVATSVPVAMGAALAACALPWLHLKMALASVGLGVLAAARLRGRALAAFVAVAAVGALAFGAYYRSVFGTPSPLAIYGGVPQDVATGTPVRAFLGLWLDRSFGLLPYAPVFLLAFSGSILMARRGLPESAPYFGLGLAVLLPALAWRMWWGGQCPPGRLLVPLVPMLAVAIAQAVACGRGFLVRARVPLLAVSWALALFLVRRPEDRLLLNRADRPTRLWEAVAPRVGEVMPSLISTQPRDAVLAGAWTLGLGLLVWLDVRSSGRP
jgi:hypothetical protein